MHVLSVTVRPVLVQHGVDSDNAAVDVSERHNPEISSRAPCDTCEKSPSGGCMTAVLIVSENVCEKFFAIRILVLVADDDY